MKSLDSHQTHYYHERVGSIRQGIPHLQTLMFIEMMQVWDYCFGTSGNYTGSQGIVAQILLSPCGYLGRFRLHLPAHFHIQRLPVYWQPACSSFQLTHMSCDNHNANRWVEASQREDKQLIQCSHFTTRVSLAVHVGNLDGMVKIFVGLSWKLCCQQQLKRALVQWRPTGRQKCSYLHHHGGF